MADQFDNQTTGEQKEAANALINDPEKTWGFRMRQKLINMIRDVEAKFNLPPCEIKT